MLSPIARRVTSGRLRLEGAFGTRSAPGCRAWPLDHQIGYLSVDDVHVPVSAPRELRIVRDQNDRRAHVIDLLEQVHYLTRHEGVEVSGRLIREQEGGIPGDRPRDRNALLLAARQLRGHVLHARGEPDELER